MRIRSVHASVVGKVVGMYLELKEQVGGSKPHRGSSLSRQKHGRGSGVEYSQGHISIDKEQWLRIETHHSWPLIYQTGTLIIAFRGIHHSPVLLSNNQVANRKEHC